MTPWYPCCERGTNQATPTVLQCGVDNCGRTGRITPHYFYPLACDACETEFLEEWDKAYFAIQDKVNNTSSSNKENKENEKKMSDDERVKMRDRLEEENESLHNEYENEKATLAARWEDLMEDTKESIRNRNEPVEQLDTTELDYDQFENRYQELFEEYEGKLSK
jgi:type I site-specific restriction endonuclease